MFFLPKNACVHAMCTLLMVSIVCLTTSAQKLSTNGRIIANVRAESGDELTKATIVITPGPLNRLTDLNGNFELDLSPGTYRIVVTYVNMEPDTSSIVINTGEVLKKTFVLRSKVSAGIVITGRSKKPAGSVNEVLLLQKSAATVSDVIGSQQITRTPSVTTADVLNKINGVTVVDNRFVVIRGMGERYNTTLLNGALVPSTDPSKKNFSFDVLPSNTVERIIVTKTASSDLPADFSGGVVQVITKEVPDRNTLSFTVGTGYNTMSTGREFLSQPITSNSYFGKLDDNRRWYYKDWNPDEYGKIIGNNGSTKEMNARIPNTWQLYSYTAMPTQTYQLSAGFRRKFKNNSSFGFIAAGSYRNAQNIESDLRQLNGQDSLNATNYNFMTDIGALVTLNYNIGSSKFSYRNVYSKKYTQDASIFSGFNTNIDLIKSTTSEINTVDVLQNRLEGEHLISKRYKLRAKWYADISEVNNNLHDRRAAPRLGQSGGNTFVYRFDDVRPENGGISASRYIETRKNAGFEISIPLELFKKTGTIIKAGYLYSARDADYSFTFLRYRSGRNFNSATDLSLYLPIYDLTTKENILSELYTYQATSISARGSNTVGISGADIFSGKTVNQNIFLMGDINFSPKLRLAAGFRYEGYELETLLVAGRDSITYEPKSFDRSGAFEQKNIYPSVNFTYKANNKINVRFSYSRTTARPDFREIVNVAYFNFETGNTIAGNAALTPADIYNYDLRFEIFPKQDEVLSATIFYKEFQNAIENNLRNDGSGNFIISPVNVKNSTNIGGEIDFRKSLGFISKQSKLLKRLYINGNASYMISEVLTDTSRSGVVNTVPRKRPLQGLSPYSINAGLLYDGTIAGFNISYNRFGRRILYQGDAEGDDIYENSRDVIDGQVYVRLFKNKMELKLNVRDILNQPFILYSNVNWRTGTPTTPPEIIGTSGRRIPNNNNKNYTPGEDFVRRRWVRGTSFSFSVTYRIP
jgi:TonB-dependent receptor